MASEISNIIASGAGAAHSRAASPAPSFNAGNSAGLQVAKAQTIAIPEKPALMTPKRADIKFDAAAERQNLKEAVSLLNDQMSSSKTGLGFSYNESIDAPVVTVLNTQTGEVVRQIPNEVVIRVAQSIDQFKGLLHNQKV
jgi:flagellar protein FlaG